MKHLLSTLTIIIYLVAIILFASGIVVTSLGIYDFFHSFHHLRADGNLPVDMIVTGILKAVDLFLIGVVIFMFSLGLLILFRRKSAPLPDELPDWLRVKDFLHLKIVLWEAILTALVVSYLAGLAELKFRELPITYAALIVPGGILLLAVSLYFLKKGEK
ncbi:MAG: YqhA family protein [Bacteroidota bacterium]|jgi:uncharacterized membrane protein YqhA